MKSRIKIILSKYSFLPDYQYISLVPLIVILNACSPHPAAYTWVTHNENALGINKITVMFEGTADFYSAHDGQPIRRCFWAAKTRNAIKLDCVHSDNTDIKESFELEVTDSDKARLSRNNSLITLLSRQAIRDEELRQIEEEEKKHKA